MREVNNLEDTLEICKALSSPLRIKILRLLAKNHQINLNELAERLEVTNGAITQQMKILIDAGLVDLTYASGKRGSQKICILKEHKFLIDILSDVKRENIYQTDIPIGSYTTYSAYPTCGIATPTHLIGEVDDPRYFDDPQRTEAGILWISKGFITYRIPNYLKPEHKIRQIQISFEISSEAPGVCEDWPSDIHFHLNDQFLGFWTSPGDYGASKGMYTPSWWFPNWNQHGLLKLLAINSEGTYMDGRKISDINLETLNLNYKSDIIFRLSVPESAENIGGMTLFGKGFGNYNQNINVRIIFEDQNNEAGENE